MTKIFQKAPRWMKTKSFYIWAHVFLGLIIGAVKFYDHWKRDKDLLVALSWGLFMFVLYALVVSFYGLRGIDRIERQRQERKNEKSSREDD